MSVPTKLKIKKYIHRHADGTVWAKGSMLGKKMHGRWTWFRKDGTKMRTGEFRSGKQAGKWVTYNKKGEIVKTTLFNTA